MLCSTTNSTPHFPPDSATQTDDYVFRIVLPSTTSGKTTESQLTPGIRQGDSFYSEGGARGKSGKSYQHLGGFVTVEGNLFGGCVIVGSTAGLARVSAYEVNILINF